MALPATTRRESPAKMLPRPSSPVKGDRKSDAKRRNVLGRLAALRAERLGDSETVSWHQETTL
jgi:hypothetical protein